jgi:hypothetical protein
VLAVVFRVLELIWAGVQLLHVTKTKSAETEPKIAFAVTYEDGSEDIINSSLPPTGRWKGRIGRR